MIAKTSTQLKYAKCLRQSARLFIRNMGVLDSSRTPCGQPIAISHAHALMLLLEAGHERRSLRHSDLVEELAIDKSNISRMVEKLTDSGLIDEQTDSADARARVLHLTRSGRAMAERIDHASLSLFANIWKTIPKDSRHDVLTALETLACAAAICRNSQEKKEK